MLFVTSLEALIVPRSGWRKRKVTKRFVVALIDLCPGAVDSVLEHDNVEQAFDFRRRGAKARQRKDLLERIYELRSNPIHSGIGPSSAGDLMSMFADVSAMRAALLSDLARGAILAFLQAPRSSLIGHPMFDTATG
jgi:hypothetical protein